MDTLDSQDISGKRVKIIDEDNDAVLGTVETVDYVRGKIGLMADGQNGRLEYYFKCDIKKIFVIDDSGGDGAKNDDRRAFQTGIGNRKSVESTSSDGKSVESTSSDGKSVESSSSDRKSVHSRSGDRRVVESCSSDTKFVESNFSDTKVVESRSSDGKTVESSSSESRVIESRSSDGKTVESSSSDSRVVESRSSDGKTVESSFSDLDKTFYSLSSDSRDRFSDVGKKNTEDQIKANPSNMTAPFPKCDQQKDNFAKCDISSQNKTRSSESETSCDGFKSLNVSSESEKCQFPENTSKDTMDVTQPDSLLKRGYKTENDLLRNYQPVETKKVLDRQKLERTEILKSYDDETGFSFKTLPPVSPRTPSFQVSTSTKQHKHIRDLLWKSPNEAPVFQTPARIYTIDKVDELYEEAVERIRLEPVIGVSLEGELLGRVGKLCYLLISTPQDVFMFDMIQLGQDSLVYGVKGILQDENIVKVLHDARQASDILFHQYEVTLVNVFDTLAADIVFHLNCCVHLQQNARSVNRLAKEYLAVQDQDLFFPKYRRSRLKEDTSIWRQRPLPNDLILGAARRINYLLPLRDICSLAVKLPFRRGVSALLSCVRDADDADDAVMIHETALLPSQVRSVLMAGDKVCS